MASTYVSCIRYGERGLSMLSFKPSDVETMVREVTDKEVAFYLEHGWVMLRGLIVPELADELRKVAEQYVESKPEKFPQQLAMNPQLEPYPAFVFSEVMRCNA